MERGEILAVYERGPEAVVALVEALIEGQRAQLAALAARVEELEDRLAADSRNSSEPPASDPAPKPRSLREKTGRKPGGQAGRKGVTLSWSDEPDRVVAHAPKDCGGCGAPLAGAETVGRERRQVVDLPELRLVTTEHVVERKRCGVCGSIAAGRFPVEAAGAVSYGPSIRGLGVYLNQYQLLPYGRARELLADLFGCSFSAGALHSAVERCHESLGGTEEAIKRGLRRAAVAHFDETALDVAGGRRWLHVAGTHSLTHYGVHPKRGTEAMREVGVLPGFGGVAVHDGLYSYGEFGCEHALCNVHHLRELLFVEEQHEQGWAGRMRALLLEMRGAVEEAVGGGQATSLEPGSGYEARYRALVDEGLEANPPAVTGKPGRRKRTKGGNLADRLYKHQADVLRFIRDFRVPFDNNLAERDIRMVKVQQKVSGCFRTERGAAMFCRIRGYISTARKQGHNPLSALQAACSGYPLLLTGAE